MRHSRNNCKKFNEFKNIYFFVFYKAVLNHFYHLVDMPELKHLFLSVPFYRKKSESKKKFQINKHVHSERSEGQNEYDEYCCSICTVRSNRFTFALSNIRNRSNIRTYSYSFFRNAHAYK